MRDDRLFFLQDAQIPNIAAFFAGKTFSFAICVMNNFSSLLLAFMVLFSSTTIEEKEPSSLGAFILRLEREQA